MNIQIEKRLYRAVKKKYSSLEYLIEETIPAISSHNLKLLPRYDIIYTETICVTISEDIIDMIKTYMSEEWSIDGLINYIIALGFIMEV